MKLQVGYVDETVSPRVSIDKAMRSKTNYPINSFVLSVYVCLMVHLRRDFVFLKAVLLATAVGV